MLGPEAIILNRLKTRFCINILLTFQNNLLKRTDSFSRKMYINIKKTGCFALAIESVSCSICNTFNMLIISLQPFIVCASVFFLTIVGELFTPCVEGSFNSVYILKHLINQLVFLSKL